MEKEGIRGRYNMTLLAFAHQMPTKKMTLSRSYTGVWDV